MLNRNETGLIVVDIQGKLARLVHDSESLIANCEKLIKGARILGLPIIVLEQNPQRLGATVKELSKELKDINPIAKFTFNGCESADFSQLARKQNVDTWLVCGIEAHICVYQTAIGLIELGYNVELVTDCISSRQITDKQIGIDRTRVHGAALTSLEMCLYELVRDCRSPEFKPILQLVR